MSCRLPRVCLNGTKPTQATHILARCVNLIDAVNTTGPTSVTQGNMTLQITVSGGNTEFMWMYTQNGIDYQAKGVMMDIPKQHSHNHD